MNDALVMPTIVDTTSLSKASSPPAIERMILSAFIIRVITLVVLVSAREKLGMRWSAT